jgi:hypothetical protein
MLAPVDAFARPPHRRSGPDWEQTDLGESVAIPCLGRRIEVDAIYGA